MSDFQRAGLFYLFMSLPFAILLVFLVVDRVRLTTRIIRLEAHNAKLALESAKRWEEIMRKTESLERIQGYCHELCVNDLPSDSPIWEIKSMAYRAI